MYNRNRKKAPGYTKEQEKTVLHIILIQNLGSYGVELNWIQEYLSLNIQVVVMEGSGVEYVLK